MMIAMFMALGIGVVVASAAPSPVNAAEQCPDMWLVQRHLIQVSKIARVFRDGIDKAYITFTRADVGSKIDDLAASRVFAVQSFLTNHLEAVHVHAWQTVEILSERSAVTPRRSAIHVAAYFTSKIAADLERIAHYESYSGNLYDGVSNLARQKVLAQPHTAIGTQYGLCFASLLQGLRKELGNVTHALRQITRCLE